MKLFFVGYSIALIVMAIVGYDLASEVWGSHNYYQLRSGITPKYFATDLALYDLPSISVSLPNSQGQPTHVRIDISLEVARKDLIRIEGLQPRLTSHITSFMQKKNIDTIRSHDSLIGLHYELLNEVAASQPVPVHEVVFRQFMLL